MDILTDRDLQGFTTTQPGWQRVLDSHKALLQERDRLIGVIYALEVRLQELGVEVDSPMMVSWTQEGA